MPKQANPQRRAFWLKHLHRWHWISSAACLMGMLLFAITGLTLNNASLIEAKPEVKTETRELPEPLQRLLSQNTSTDKQPLPGALVDWLAMELAVQAEGKPAEWSEEEIYLSLPRPGGDAWLSIDRASGELTYELTQRGWVAYLNDLHKGRNTGTAWSWFLDLFAIAALLFSLTGLFLLQIHAGQRPATWPMVGLGLVLPVVLALLFIH